MTTKPTKLLYNQLSQWRESKSGHPNWRKKIRAVRRIWTWVWGKFKAWTVSVSDYLPSDWIPPWCVPLLAAASHLCGVGRILELRVAPCLTRVWAYMAQRPACVISGFVMVVMQNSTMLSETLRGVAELVGRSVHALKVGLCLILHSSIIKMKWLGNTMHRL